MHSSISLHLVWGGGQDGFFFSKNIFWWAVVGGCVAVWLIDMIDCTFVLYNMVPGTVFFCWLVCALLAICYRFRACERRSLTDRGLVLWWSHVYIRQQMQLGNQRNWPCWWYTHAVAPSHSSYYKHTYIWYVRAKYVPPLFAWISWPVWAANITAVICPCQQQAAGVDETFYYYDGDVVSLSNNNAGYV